MAEAITLETIFETLNKVANGLKDKPSNNQLTVALRSLNNCVENLANIVQNEQNKEMNWKTPSKNMRTRLTISNRRA